MRNPKAGMVRSIFAFTALLAVATVHAQQSVNVVAANSVSNQILGVTFAPPATSVLNTDTKSLYSLVSLAFIPVNNSLTNTFSFDLLAADNQNGKILRYVGDFSSPPNPPVTTGTVVTQAAQIIYPNGLSVDSAGDLFVVNDAPGSSRLPQVWALQSDGSGGLQSAVRIDTNSWGKQQAAVETLIVGPPFGAAPNVTPAANSGDLLVLTTNPNTVLIYPGSNGNGPLAPQTPTILIGQCPNTQSTNCIPAAAVPAGMAVWPEDNSLLIATSGGSILQASFANGALTQVVNFATGLPGGLVKIKTGLQPGGALAFVAQSGPGNHGSILELGRCANNPSNPVCANSPPGIVLLATVTARVAAPQGIAATNTVRAPEVGCLAGQAPGTGGCDLFGNQLNKHTVKPINPGNPPTSVSNIVESLCVVPKDPRFPCDGVKTLYVNDVCPGIDTTNGFNKMIIPGYACGSPGFALIKTLTAHDQFNGTLIDTEQNASAVFPSGSNPTCGMVMWAPNGGETRIAEEQVNITDPNATPFPTMVDTSDGCGSGKGGVPLVSVFGSGFQLVLPAGNTPLQTFVQQKYTNLRQTIQQLSAPGAANVSSTVASQLTNGVNGCVDLSLSLFNKAMAEGSNSGPLTQQQIYDFQDAADLLTNADATGTTTCDSIVTNAAINVPGAFNETPGGAAPVFNPTGQLRWRFANISNAITMRILNLAPASTFPTPVSLSASPQYVIAQCTFQLCPPPQSQVPLTATLSWALVNGASNCTYGNFNPNQPTVGPFTTPGTTSTYTLGCSTVPRATVPSTATGFSVATYVTVWPEVAVVTNPTSVVAGASSVVTWTPPGGATGCTLITNGQGTLGASTAVGAGYQATYTSNAADAQTNGGIVDFTAYCTAGASAGSASITVSAPVSPVVVTVNPSPPSSIGDDGAHAKVTWTPPTLGAAAVCTLSSDANPSGGGSFTAGTTSVNGPTNGTTQYQATYTSTEADPKHNNGIVTFTAACTGATSGKARLIVSESP